MTSKYALSRFIVPSLCLLLLGSGSVWAKTVRDVDGVTRWSGEVAVTSPLLVPRGTTLQIAAGSVVRVTNPAAAWQIHGRLEIAGSEAAPVVILAPRGWKGIELLEPEGVSLFDHLSIDGADVAISGTSARFTVRHCAFRNCGVAIKLLRESFPLVEDSLFEGNRLGIDSEMKSTATVRRNLFRGHSKAALLASHNSRGVIELNRFEANEQGIALLQSYPDPVKGNTFVANRTAIYCHQTQGTPEILGNNFQNNQTAIANVSYSSPAIQDNVFSGSGKGVHNDQQGAPRVRHNLFRGNEVAIYNYRKSNPLVELNVFESNALALFCDYSSYPRVQQNNFRRNGMGVKLGRYQSGEWEQRFGSQAIMQNEMSQRSGRNPQNPRDAQPVRDVVDVSGNWWGDDTVKLSRAGEAGNLEMFYDRRDEPRVVYEDFGSESYAFDLIRFAPWLSEPVPSSGPRR